ncbi:MAG: hypothetical protein CVU05_03665 [Bacteroidetes bacterium HGW-Bacteroidetes-21]|nr:MAG: hypothetical protein CVU05_03665 [Bacteroidetes bacterium HGW-Bacteroidetes-21]
MKTNNRVFLFIAGLILFSSCVQPVSHDKEVTYFITIATEMNNTTSIVNDFWHEAFEATKTAQQNQDMKLDSSYINTLNKSYQISTLALSNSIEKLSTVEEIDPSINLKERTLTHLKDIKRLQESALPVVIKLLGTGLGNLTDKERESFEEFKIKGGELQATSDELKKLAFDFQDQHKITGEELAKYGL